MLIAVTRNGRLHAQSNATNAFDLCRDAAQCIREEPKRYDQGDWLSILGDHTDSDRRDQFPACGTIACRAGWLVVCATAGAAHLSEFSIPHQAHWLLGVTDDDAEVSTEFYRDICALFEGNALFKEIRQARGLSACEYMPEPIPRIGTPGYAELGAAGLDAFSEKWKTRLLATPLSRPIL